jgi:hypothetical protein
VGDCAGAAGGDEEMLTGVIGPAIVVGVVCAGAGVLSDGAGVESSGAAGVGAGAGAGVGTGASCFLAAIGFAICRGAEVRVDGRSSTRDSPVIGVGSTVRWWWVGAGGGEEITTGATGPVAFRTALWTGATRFTGATRTAA